MIVKPTALADVMLLENFVSHDKRGIFVKTFHAGAFREHGLAVDFRESYYSVSHKDVVRGMHFQLPPYEHDKLVYVTQGRILDVIVDLRSSSPFYLQFAAIELKEHVNAVYIPRGFAHGFLTLSNTATVVYNVNSVYEATADSGIRWDTIGFSWPVRTPVVSDRDAAFGSMADLQSTF
ncbi:dTDP-4-dehydrorhamnose 3,5-epimerase [Hymenobacter sp. BT770]|uniref:dTDP-4-dehydrorhamnose 3,5-epimerase n=1 Tax=Hymenobacter sp. BT770 TaxID=2886942 RepID=UPI001D120BA8|nr:dTDP-4-dehydrorhamnose 3,5-epimerase [Hymenobacter sp. BT770]MCC3153812.1 dTDP-4-dehydrorhamnose 3,5-epimerase [Hymenobacter sp. BT770]MDO3415956.1 dTDP-4-dehydrorhamnose 3,5-epimerase [Hymenobacter sp. BT770]